MPTVEGLQFRYALHPLEPGKMGLHRWRWELWHGAYLAAAGWRLSRQDAERALAKHGAAFGHRLFGLRSPGTLPPVDLAGLRRAAAVRVETGTIAFELVPAAVERPASALAA
jgi:hypothetical protein